MKRARFLQKDIGVKKPGRWTLVVLLALTLCLRWLRGGRGLGSFRRLHLAQCNAAFDQGSGDVFVLCILLEGDEQCRKCMLTHGAVVVAAQSLERKHGSSAIFDGKLKFVCFGQPLCEGLDGVDGRLICASRFGQLRVLLAQNVKAMQHRDRDCGGAHSTESGFGGAKDNKLSLALECSRNT